MTPWQALLLGLVQGLTEFLPVSSSGHLALGTSILQLPEEDLTFSILVHGATALSTIVVFRGDIARLIKNFLKEGDEGLKARKYVGLIAISAIPAAVIGLSMKETIESIASYQFVGAMLIITAVILAVSQRVTPKSEKTEEQVRPLGSIPYRKRIQHGQNVLVFEHFKAWDFSVDDFGENHERPSHVSVQ